MKALIIACLLSLCLAIPSIGAAGETAYKTPDMRGTWTGTFHMHKKSVGFAKGDAAYLVIKKQDGPLFHGAKHWKAKGKEYKEDFSGVVTVEGDVYLAEANDGHSVGKLDKDGVLMLYFVQSGGDHTVIMYRFTKKK